MRVRFREKEFIMWGILAATVFAIGMLVIGQLIKTHDYNKQSFLDVELKRFEGEVKATLETYETFSHYIYDQLVQEEDILAIMHEAGNGSMEVKDELRQQLFVLLHTQYESMERYGFKQLHFHLPTTESFLRMHAPDTYGDFLGEVRETIRIANAEQRYVMGFEEGQLYNAFRFVYPLQYQGNHVGTVDISMSSASILKVLSTLYPAEDFHVIIEKSAIEEKLFESARDNYIKTNISDQYYMDRDVEEIITSYNDIVPSPISDFMAVLHKHYSSAIEDKESFSGVFSYQKQDYIIKFLSIKNVSDQPIAYIISIARTNDYIHLKQDLYKQIFLIALLALIVVVFSFFIFIFQYKLRTSSQLDYLTKAYNRQSFYEISHREVKRAKRYNQELSVMMMDIDHFKKINDTYGHEVGDLVLKELTKVVTSNIRSSDIFARWGGEEFVLLLPNTGMKSAMCEAERIRKIVAAVPETLMRKATISIGVATFDFEHYDINKAIDLADEAMYFAKKDGRNRAYSAEQLKK